MVEMHLSAVRVEIPSNNPLLLLQETTGSRRTLPIYIGPAEAQAIAFAQQGVETPRPMTHDLMRDVIQELGARVECIVITELRERTFYAEIRILLGSTRHSVSARPSDAVALAVRIDCPIYAEEELIDAEGMVLPEDDEDGDDTAEAEELVSEFRDFIEGIRPEDFGA
ncbi:MAG TPA: bifunctional nuclease family protein [Acidimicrobiales bacterium]|nr:bifunctional nuclease family protein [Acidimicrobiales bacterium]